MNSIHVECRSHRNTRVISTWMGKNNPTQSGFDVMYNTCLKAFDHVNKTIIRIYFMVCWILGYRGMSSNCHSVASSHW